MDEMSTDYGWNKEHNNSPDYLVSSLIKIFDTYVNCQELILDAGCGGGHLLNVLYEIKCSNLRGFDVSQSGINVVKDVYPHLQNLVAVHNGYNKTLPKDFPQNDYGLILSVEVIEHLYNPKVYIDNIYSWLKQGGYLIISTPYHGFFKNLSISLMNKHDTHYDPLWDGGHVKFFSKNTLTRVLNSSGFEIVDFIGSGRIPYLWKSMIVIAKKNI